MDYDSRCLEKQDEADSVHLNFLTSPREKSDVGVVFSATALAVARLRGLLRSKPHPELKSI